ncbi:MAG TPA: MFS transporter [Candidatus Deferrimicrobium sp.]|nr:MFS transporter [Candidatus Deferrimicrobium sp.]
MTKPKFYGWKLVAVLFLLYLAAAIALYGGNIANTYMAKLMNMSRSLFGAGFAAAYLLVGLGSALAAVVTNKKGERFTLSLGMAGVTAGALLMALWGQTPVGYILFFGLIIGTGFAFATVLPIQTIITRWFQRKRALATAIVLTAGGVGGIVAAPLVNNLIETTDGNWKLAWVCMGILAAVTTVVAALFTRNNPAEMGQFPDGIQLQPQENNAAEKKVRKVYQSQESWTLKEALKTAPIWIIILAAIGQFVGFYLCIGHGVIHLMDLGAANETAALSLGILAFASIGGRLLSGVLGDRIEPRFVIMAGLLLTIAGCLMVINATTVLSIYLYAILVGAGFGLVYVCLFTMLGNYYGAGKIQNFLGFMIPIITLFGASAPLVGGIIKDKTGSYTGAFIGTIVIAAIGFISLFFASPPKKNKQ